MRSKARSIGVEVADEKTLVAAAECVGINARWSFAHEHRAFQTDAIVEGIVADGGDGGRETHARQAGATIKRIFTEADETLMKGHAGQAGAIGEGGVANAGDSGRNVDARETAARVESTESDLGQP